MEDRAGARQALSYQPEADLNDRHPEWTVATVALGWGIREVLSPEWKVILLDSAGSPAAARCSLAHAVAHLDLGHGALPAGLYELRQEREADLLAARRLMPVSDLLDVFVWTADCGEAAAELGVVPKLLSLRLATLLPAERRMFERCASLAA